MDNEENNMNQPVSIIVPCLNEEYFIGILLKCLAKQTFQHFEVIVVDGLSSDDTCGAVERTVARLPSLVDKVRCIVSDKKGVSYQRNRGASEAKYERILFLDADMQLPDSFLEITLAEIEKFGLDVATTIFEPISDRVDDRFFYYLGNVYIQLQQYIRPVAMGFCIFTTRTVHERLGGFNEELSLSEDYDYVQRAGKQKVEFKVLTQARAYVSIRRMQKEGRFTYYKKAVLSEMLNLVMDKKEVAASIVYTFGEHDQTAK